MTILVKDPKFLRALGSEMSYTCPDLKLLNSVFESQYRITPGS